MIVPDYITMRHVFSAKIVESGVSLTFADAGPDTITRGSGSFVTQGYQAGMTVEAVGSTSNDKLYTIATGGVAASVLTLVGEDSATAEGPVSCDVVAYWRYADGLPEFPGPQTRGTSLLRANGFDGGLTLVSVQDSDFETRFTANVGAADAAMGTDEYDWWLSDRTEVSANRLLSLTQKAASGSSTYSGTVDVSLTALAVTALGISLPGTLTTQQLVHLFKYAHLYCRRRSDGAYQWVDLLEAHLLRLE